MFWKNWSWSARILSVVALGAVTAILFPVFARAPESHGPGYSRRSCISNLKQIGLAFVQYEQDYDEHFPLVITGHSAHGWAGALQPYLKSTTLYHCPSAKVDMGQDFQHPNPLQGGYTDYPFNAKLDRTWLGSIDKPVWQIVSLDGNDGLEVTNARYCLTQIPPTWRSDKSSPLYRHLETANYLFADGHVKGMKPTHFFNNKDIVF